MSRFGLVAAFTVRSLYNSDNYIGMELEILGTLFLPQGHYSNMKPLLTMGIRRAAQQGREHHIWHVGYMLDSQYVNN